MTPDEEHVRQLILMVLRSSLGEEYVIQVPEGVAVLSTGGSHTLIRIDAARLEAAR